MNILWIPHTGWHIPQRAHLFCRALTERHTVHITDWVADFASPRDYLSRRYLENFAYRRYRDGNVSVHGIPRISPALFFPVLRRLNNAIFERFVQRIVVSYDIDVVVGSFVVPPPNAPRLVFDIFDDNPAYWREFAGNPVLAKEVEDCETTWIKASDRIVVVSSVLKDKLIHQFGPEIIRRTHLIPNGVPLARYRLANGTRVRSALGIGDRRVTGLISGLGEFSGIGRYLEAIRLLNDRDVVHLIVGDGSLLPVAKEMIDRHKLSNVIMTGRIPSSEIADYYAALDVGVIPFDLADFTHSACPMKLLEYVACRKRVVSTPLEEVKRMDFAGVTFAGPDVRSFAEGLREALDTPTPSVTDLDCYDIPYVVNEYERILRDTI